MVERLGCRWPIIQTAMGWVAEPALVIAACEAGAFGFLGAAVMTAAETRDKILAVRRGTEKCFGVNFHSFQPGAAEIVELIIANKAQIRAVSFGRGPDAGMIARFRQAGILCVPTVGAVKHALAMQKLGVDMVNVQGGEGGGHTGSVPTTVLLPQVLDAVKIPVIASGGFADGRGLAAALAYGAVGMAMGTRFFADQRKPGAGAGKGGVPEGQHQRDHRDDQARRHSAADGADQAAGPDRAFRQSRAVAARAGGGKRDAQADRSKLGPQCSRRRAGWSAMAT